MKAIYQPKGAAAEYGAWACNLYNGCSNMCDYCYNRHCPQGTLLGKDTPTLKKSLVDEKTTFEIFKKEFNKHKDTIIKDGGIFFSFVSDPMLPKTCSLTMLCASYAMNNDCPVIILTKGYIPVTWAKNQKQGLLKAGFTLTGMDEMEHGHHNTAKRIANMSELKAKGVYTWASIEPVIDMKRAIKTIQDSSPYCDEYRIGLANHIGMSFTPAKVKKFMQDAINSAPNAKTITFKKGIMNLINKNQHKGEFNQ